MSVMPCDGQAICPPKESPPPTPLEKVLRVFSVVTMLMTIPQVVTIWTEGAAGVSAYTWLTYLASAVAWMIYGIQKRDKTIYVACIGWIILDAAIVAGIFFRH